MERLFYFKLVLKVFIRSSYLSIGPLSVILGKDSSASSQFKSCLYPIEFDTLGPVRPRV